MRGWTIFAGVLAALASPLAAEETRVAPEGHTPPPATLDQVDWLVGQWTGTGIAGAPAHESWLAPTGGTMVGTFVQQNADDTIMFTEHMYLMEEEGSLVLRLKHFNADLTAWEDKEGMVTFTLIELEDCAAYFRALTLRCDGDDGLLAAVRMKNAAGEINELVFRFDRTEGPLPTRCPDATSTPEIDACHAAVLERADERRAQYLAKAIERNGDRPALAEKIAASDAAFLAYREAECGAVLEDWMQGSIRGVMTLSCKIAMTDQRTSQIWQNWLTYMDSSPPLLPKPAPTR